MNFCRWKSSKLLASTLAIAFAFAAGTAPAIGQSTRTSAVTSAIPGISKADQAVEDQTLRTGEGDAKPAAARPATETAGSSSAGDLVRIVFALGVVIGIILLLRAGLRKMSDLPGTGRNKLVTVLSRSMISPRQQILVLQVGKRLLVVGDSGGSMSQLCELTDPDEIASLIGQVRQPSDPLYDPKKVSFGNIFRRTTETFDEEPETQEETLAPSSDASITVPSVEEVGGLLDKIKLLQQQYKLKS